MLRLSLVGSRWFTQDWQGRVEAEQDELHESITDMQSLVQQHAGQVQEMLRAVDCLLDQGHTAGLSHVHSPDS